MLPLDSETLSAIVRDAPIYIVVLDRNLEIRFINAGGPAGSVEELVGTPIAAYLRPAEQERNMALLREVLTTGTPLSYTAVPDLPEGQTVYYETAARPLVVEGEILGITLYARDITARVSAIRELDALRVVMERAETVAHFGSFEIRYGPGGEQVKLSKELHRMLELDPAAEAPPTAAHLSEKVHPDDRERVRSAIDLLLQRGAPFEVDYRVLFGDGSIKWMRSQTEPIVNEEGTTAGMAGILRDITEERRAASEREELESQIRQGQKMEAVGTLASGVAHDFNNLLMGVSGCARMALDRVSAGDPARPFLEEILRAVQSGAAITQQLLAFTRRRTAEPSVFDLNAAVAAQQAMLNRLLGEDVELVIRLYPEHCWVRLDPIQMEQVLMNLAVNARDAMPGGGRLLITTQSFEDGAHTPTSMLEGPQVMLVVSDTGGGIPEEIRERIFEPFFTTKEAGKGTGLGLSTTYAIVQQAGGDIVVESREGEGATFRIVLPRAPEPALEATPPDKETKAPVHTEATVLLVEDEPLVRLATRHFLLEAGCQVLEAGNGLEALEAWRSHPDEIDVVLTDVILPKMNGPLLVEEIWKIDAGVKFLFMSAHDEAWLKERWPLGPEVPLLQKPFDAETLVSKLRQVLQ